MNTDKYSNLDRNNIKNAAALTEEEKLQMIN